MTQVRNGKKVDNQCAGNADNQNAMVSAVAASNEKTIVVASVPGAILMPWSGSVAAILTNFMPGQQAGNAIADVLFGKVNPSAKLPITMPNKENETAFSPAQWPGYPNTTLPQHATYSEKLLVGYRYYDYHNISFTTGFPFGHGLSYTEFGYSALAVVKDETGIPSQVTAKIENAGKVAGAEVAQLYIGFPAAAGEPPKLLKAFIKATLAPGQSTTVAFDLTARDFSIWDVEATAWKIVNGAFTIHVGSSSRDIRLVGSVTVDAI